MCWRGRSCADGRRCRPPPLHPGPRWTEADGKEFNKRAAVMVAQANKFVVHAAAAAGPDAPCKGAADGPLRLAGGLGSVCSCKTVNGALTNGRASLPLPPGAPLHSRGAVLSSPGC